MNKHNVITSIVVVFLLLFASCSENEKNYYNWAMQNNGEEVCGVKGKKGIDIGAENTSYDWNGKPMLIAIVDSGVQASSNASLEDIVCNPVELASNDMHAISVAGIISTNSQSTYKSVLKDAPIYNISVEQNCLDVAKLIDDLTLAESKGIRVVNMSFTMNYYCQELYEYMQNSKMLFVCAAGNEHKNYIPYPASFDLENIISVVGMNNWGYCSRFSNYSVCADIAAPGENVLCISQNNSLGYFSGTSFAAPYVTACCAYLMSEIDCCAVEAKKIILDCAEKNEALNGYVKDGKMLSIKNVISYISTMQALTVTHQDSLIETQPAVHLPGGLAFRGLLCGGGCGPAPAKPVPEERVGRDVYARQDRAVSLYAHGRWNRKKVEGRVEVERCPVRGEPPFLFPLFLSLPFSAVNCQGRVWSSLRKQNSREHPLEKQDKRMLFFARSIERICNITKKQKYFP